MDWRCIRDTVWCIAAVFLSLLTRTIPLQTVMVNRMVQKNIFTIGFDVECYQKSFDGINTIIANEPAIFEFV